MYLFPSIRGYKRLNRFLDNISSKYDICGTYSLVNAFSESESQIKRYSIYLFSNFCFILCLKVGFMFPNKFIPKQNRNS